MNQFSIHDFSWLNKPARYNNANNQVEIFTEPGTDLWQRTYYGFRHNNAPAFLMEMEGDFTFAVKATYKANYLYDQCGLLMYYNSENWLKVSVEYENEEISRLGSVVTNLGYSDWATTDIPSAVTQIWYRLSRRGQDFYIEYSFDDKNFKQMRILHMHVDINKINIGVYACSPLESSFKAVFSDFKISECLWELH